MDIWTEVTQLQKQAKGQFICKIYIYSSRKKQMVKNNYNNSKYNVKSSSYICKGK